MRQLAATGAQWCRGSEILPAVDLDSPSGDIQGPLSRQQLPCAPTEEEASSSTSSSSDSEDELEQSDLKEARLKERESTFPTCMNRQKKADTSWRSHCVAERS
ncbi:unnamed protein product [Polarella glacialis]|uniref:Uncharacterized protein n=1 Tax=Polarella glacialis TaxID=89957 RepID=A0A813HE65_POLGL|nr:unnamed protein product [Polarella glacialis]